MGKAFNRHFKSRVSWYIYFLVPLISNVQMCSKALNIKANQVSTENSFIFIGSEYNGCLRYTSAPRHFWPSSEELLWLCPHASLCVQTSSVLGSMTCQGARRSVAHLNPLLRSPSELLRRWGLQWIHIPPATSGPNFSLLPVGNSTSRLVL